MRNEFITLLKQNKMTAITIRKEDFTTITIRKEDFTTIYYTIENGDYCVYFKIYKSNRMIIFEEGTESSLFNQMLDDGFDCYSIAKDLASKFKRTLKRQKK